MADPGVVYSEKTLKKVEGQITKVYSEAQKDIQQKMDDFIAKHEAKDRIMSEKLKKGEISPEDYSKWQKGQVFQGNQWRQKRDQINNVLTNANKNALQIVNGGTIDVFAENCNYESFAIEQGFGINFGFGLVDANTMTQLIKEQPRLLPLKTPNIPKDKAWNQKKITNCVTQGILQGERIDKIADRIAKVTTSQNRNSMMMNARTAVTGAQNAGREQSMKHAAELGINIEKEWMATLDNRTRTSHAHLDGEKIKVGDKWHHYTFSNGCRFPGDPQGPGWEVYNCRCTLVTNFLDYPDDYERRDNVNGKKIKNMTYDEWKNQKKKVKVVIQKPIVDVFIDSFQSQLGRTNSVQEVNDLMNSQGWFSTNRAGVMSEADLTGCDLDCARSIAATYQQIFEKYPKLIGQFDAPDAHPVGMKEHTYAWCYIRNGGKVQVNPNRFSNYQGLVDSYEKDVSTNWHPEGTTAESIVTHELGHAVDGLLAREGILGGLTSSGQYRYASSTMQNTVMKRAAKIDEDIADDLEMDRYWKGNQAVVNHVSRYASKNPQEWFAECFAEYITSANPRTVATEFGQELERLLSKLP